MLLVSDSKKHKYDKIPVKIAFSDIQIIIMIMSSPHCLLSPFSSTAASAGEDDRQMALSLVGQVCHEVFQSENKIKTERKLFIREHQLQCCFLFSASLFSLPLLWVSLSFISLLFFSHSVSFPLSLSTSLARYPLFSLSPLSAAVTDFFLPRLKYEYFRAKKLKGNNEMAPKLNYTPFSESQKSDERTGATCLIFLPPHTHITLLSPAFMSCYDIPTDLASRIAKPLSGTVTKQQGPFRNHCVRLTSRLEKKSFRDNIPVVVFVSLKEKGGEVEWD